MSARTVRALGSSPAGQTVAAVGEAIVGDDALPAVLAQVRRTVAFAKLAIPVATALAFVAARMVLADTVILAVVGRTVIDIGARLAGEAVETLAEEIVVFYVHSTRAVVLARRFRAII
jgi:hypothetical protein